MRNNRAYPIWPAPPVTATRTGALLINSTPYLPRQHAGEGEGESFSRPPPIVTGHHLIDEMGCPFFAQSMRSGATTAKGNQPPRPCQCGSSARGRHTDSSHRLLEQDHSLGSRSTPTAGDYGTASPRPERLPAHRPDPLGPLGPNNARRECRCHLKVFILWPHSRWAIGRFFQTS